MTGDVGALVLAGLFLFLSAAALALMASLRRPRDPLLAAFAAFVGLFGTRLALRTEWCAGLLAGSASPCRFGADLITYVIPLPFLFAVAGLLSGRWRALARALVVGQISFAAVATGIDLATSRPGSGMRVNNAVVAGLLVLGVVYGLSRRRDWRPALGSPEGRSLGIGLALFVPVALAENLRELGLRPGPRVPEALALFVLVSCVAHALAVRANRRESAFAALERELELARAIQASVLPAGVPGLPGLDIAARFVPLSAVAGDFYDVVPDGKQGLTVIVADVTGHGVPAALVASMMKAACVSVPEELAEPARSLGRVNRLLCRMGAEQLVTAAWLHVDSSQGRFVYGGAGHPPLLVWRAVSRTVESLEENGLILGLMPEAPYAQAKGDLFSGDRLLAYTDGVTEATGPGGEQFGQHRLEAALAEGAGADANTFCRELLERLRAWHGPGSFDDDVTFVVVGIEPGRGRLSTADPPGDRLNQGRIRPPRSP